MALERPSCRLRSIGEDDVDAAIRKIDGARRHVRGAAARAAINVLDALDVGLNGRGIEGAARLGLHLGEEDLALDLAVAFEGDAIDDAVLGHLDDEPASVAAHAHVREEAGGIEVANALVDAGLIGARKVGANRLSVDALAALHNDGLRCDRTREAGAGRPEDDSSSEPVA